MEQFFQRALRADAVTVGPVVKLLKKGSDCRVQELSISSFAWTLLLLREQLGQPIVAVTDGPRTLEALYQDLHTLSGDAGEGVWFYPGWESLPGKSDSVNVDLTGDRLQTLLNCPKDQKQSFIMVTDIQALMQRTTAPNDLRAAAITVTAGAELDIDTLAERFASNGFEFTYEVLNKGEATKRGGLLDVWPIDAPYPIRIEFFGEEIESIRQFDPMSQRSVLKMDEIVVGPATESFERGLDADVFDYLPEDTCFCWYEPEQVQHHAAIYESTMRESESDNYTLDVELLHDRLATVSGGGQLFAGLTERPMKEIALPIRACEGLPDVESGSANPDLLDQARLVFLGEYSALAKAGREVIICFSTQGSLDRFREGFAPRVAGAKKIKTLLGMIHEGFLVAPDGPVIIAESDLYGLRKALRSKYDLHAKTRKGSKQLGERFAEWTDVQPGELVVHVDHGIGRYLGLYEIEFNGRIQEVMTVEYASEAKLHIPVSQAQLLSRYIAVGTSSPALHSLGGKRWHKEKEAAEQAVEDLAANLLETQAARSALPGHAYSADTPWQHDFEATFPYQETVDQEEAIIAVKKNMESTQPMDRLICGDVGYGKTEVAMRAAFKAVMDGKQVAILVPTTILCQQHYEGFIERMTSFPVTVDMLSRFRSRKEQNETIRRLARGEVDIIIGTHRLVQQDVTFKELGLVIIDEEQRFGVKHKERLKDLKQLVDVLTMTATPIPRTLYMSLTGAKEMSTISTPPRDRQPIETFVRHYDDQIIRKAILRELNREGQVFYLHNRVMTIRSEEKKLKELVPEAKIVVAHGQMPEARLEKVMHDFIAGKYDVLLCTTIIESGVDIPNANTMIVDRADRFGLAELYQLRGRVGRYKNKAYAYLLVPEKGQMSAIARKRIRAIQQYSSLGAGFKLALRDLEIRGAGNILGAQQSGHIMAVGFDLYCQLLERTVKRMKHEKVPEIVDVKVRLDFVDMSTTYSDYDTACVIPVEYIEEEGQRVDMYKALSSLKERKELSRLEQELKDRFGRLPLPMRNLLKLADLRLWASQKKIREIDVREGKVMMTRGGDFIMENGKFPRLPGGKAGKRLSELIKLVKRL